jgi:tRNA-dihydrouridine synthase A
MAEPALVADGVKAMQDAVDVPISVKHRIGLDGDESTMMLMDFVGQLHAAGCQMFIVHARNAWLKGLSPKQNREVPPLRYGVVLQLKKYFPDAHFVLNGGIQTMADMNAHADGVDGIMVGRAAYHNPWLLNHWDAWLGGRRNAGAGGSGDAVLPNPADSEAQRNEVEFAMVEYMADPKRCGGAHWYSVARHILGLRHGLPGARLWRQVWSDHRLKDRPVMDVYRLAQAALQRHALV